MPSQEILDVLRSILLLLGRISNHGKSKDKCNCICIIKDQQLQRINSCRAIGFANAHADWARVEVGEATLSQPNQLQRHHCPSFWQQVSFQAPLSCSFPLSLFLLLASHGPRRYQAVRTGGPSSACGRFVRTPQPTGLELVSC